MLEQYRGGKSAEEIARFYPSLRLKDVYAAILYYLLNRREVDAYPREYEEIGRRMTSESDANPSPAGRRVRDLRRERQEEKLRGAC